MEIETLELALHMWPPWQKTIDEARATLGYRPDFSSEEMDEWIRGHGLRSYDRVKEMARFALQLLDLPESFIWYWTACFYSDYKRPRGVIDYEAIRLGNERQRPPNPLRLRLFDKGGRWVRFQVDGPLNLVTKAEVKEWTSTILHLAQRHRHPLTTFIRRARAFVSPRKREAIRRLLEGSATFEDILREEYWSEQVDGDLRPLLNLRGINRTKAEGAYRKSVYDKVRLWCREVSVPTPRPSSGWWKRRPRL